jgi:hypothetical protein
MIEGYHASKAENHHKSVGLTGGHPDLFMIDRRLEKQLALSPKRQGWSETTNRAE